MFCSYLIIISTDLWVGGAVPGAKPSGKTAKVQYAIGSAQGPIQFADLNFLGHKVPDQAFSTCRLPLSPQFCLTDPHVL